MVIGVTGGAGAGKTLVATELERLGAKVIDADVIAREVVEPGGEALIEIEKTFGGEVIDSDGTLKRKALAELVFSDAEKLKELNSITHPRIRAEIDRRIKGFQASSPDALIVVNAALLMEVGHETDMDKVVLVTAPTDMRVERMVRRDKITPKEALDRMRSQMSEDEKKKKANFIIDNVGSKEELQRKTAELFKVLKEMK